MGVDNQPGQPESGEENYNKGPGPEAKSQELRVHM